MANRKNLANGILALGVDTDDTTWVLEDGYGAGMPDVPFYLTATPFGQLSTMGNSEIVNVTARTTDTLTVERGAKGTTAKAFDAGAVVSNGIYTDEKWTSDNIDWATSGKVWWQELGRVTLTSNSTTMTVDNLPVRKHLKVRIFARQGSTNGNLNMSFNGDMSNNYPYAVNTQASTADGSATGPGITFQSSFPANTNATVEADVFNVANREKNAQGLAINSNDAGNNIPTRRLVYGKWMNTSAAINRVDVTSSTNLVAGSEVVVLGHN